MHYHLEIDFTLEKSGEKRQNIIARRNPSQDTADVTLPLGKLGPWLQLLPLILNVVRLRAASGVPRASLKWFQTLPPPSFI